MTQPHAIVRAGHDAVHRSLPPALAAAQAGTGQPPWGQWLYAIGLSLLLLGALLRLFASIPQVPEHKPASSRNAEAPFPAIQHVSVMPAEPQLARLPPEEEGRFQAMRSVFVMTIAMTLCCGALGGCLFNMRGLIKHSLEKNFDQAYQAAYMLHPFAGALSGFIVFLVLVGGLFSMEVQPPHSSTGDLDWIILRRQLPFMAFATLAGYASHVFMMKLKDIAEVFFSIPERVNPVTKGQRKSLGGTAP